MGQTTPRRDFIKHFAASALVAGTYPTLMSIDALAPTIVKPPALFTRIGGAGRPGDRVFFGAWEPSGHITAVQRLESTLGRRMDIVHSYQGWGAENSALDAACAAAAGERGSLPLITWEPWDYRRGREQPEFRLSRIAAGHFDGYARMWAGAIKNLNAPVMLRFAHEMNGTAYPWSIGVNGNQPSDYVAAWRHLVDLFRDEGVTNVSWMWCPQAPSPISPPLADCFPGDGYVDVIGMDGYNGGTAVDWGGWLTFTEVFGPLHEQVSQLSRRPVIVAETGCAEEGGDKSQWIENAFLHELPQQFANVDAVVWFNERREADWRLDSSPRTLAVVQTLLRNI